VRIEDDGRRAVLMGRPAICLREPERVMSQGNVEVVQRFEDAFVRGDMDEVLSLLTHDVVVHEAPSLPYPGDHRGHDGFLRLADAFNAVWEIVSDLDLTFLDAGETRVVVLVAFDVMTRPTGVPLRLRLAEVYTVRDGRIADLDVYYRDTAAIVEATGGARVL
jgi:ketosteroid isomerase-like protein